MEGSGQLHAPAALTPEKNRGAFLSERFERKLILPLPRFELRVLLHTLYLVRSPSSVSHGRKAFQRRATSP